MTGKNDIEFFIDRQEEFNLSAKDIDEIRKKWKDSDKITQEIIDDLRESYENNINKYDSLILSSALSNLRYTKSQGKGAAPKLIEMGRNILVSALEEIDELNTDDTENDEFEL